MVIDLTATKFKPLLHPMYGLSLSNTMYIEIYMVQDYYHVLHNLVMYIRKEF
jgi:hypothetical protein